MCTAMYIYILAVFSTAAAGKVGSAKKRPDVNILGIALLCFLIFLLLSNWYPAL